MASQQQSVEQVFGAALEYPPAQRGAFLDEACRDAPEVRRLVEELLLADGRLGSFLETPLLGPDAIARDLSGSGDDEGVDDRRGLLPESRVAAGDLIAGRFRVVRFIARGGMGEIYEVEDLFLQNVRLALKIILPQIALTSGAARRFEQEVLLARKVIHPNLCPIYDLARSDQTSPPFLFLTMKLLSGETLASRLHGEVPISGGEACQILRQMCSGLGALHAAGIIHRDIKPTNVMLEQSGASLHLSILDFGLARLHESEMTQEGSAMLAGTPGYLAPELLRGERPSQASDIFALGVLLHMVLRSGAPELAADSPSGSRRLLERSTVHPMLRLAVREFRSDDVEQRCAAFRRVQAALEAEPSSTGSRMYPSAGRRLMTRRSLGAVAAGAVAAATLWEWDHVRDLLHPLPSKRFVALLKWPASSDSRLRPMLSGVVDMVGRELSRAEAFDRDLLVITDRAESHLENAAELAEIRDSFGANLILAASGQMEGSAIYLTLKLLDSSVNRPLRQRVLRVGSEEQTTLAARAVKASADLLGISHYTRADRHLEVGTDKPEALSAFQAGEALRRQNSAATLEQAIARLKEAVSIDPRYAVAMASLGWAYLRLYGLHNDAAALVLARENGEAALAIDPASIEAHQVLAWLYERTGDRDGAMRELTAALSLDPANPNTLLVQARLLEEMGRTADALDRLKRVLKIRPNYWQAHNDLGMLLNRSARYPEALLEFRAASLAAPKNSLAANNLGSVLLQQGKLREAESSLKQSLVLDANDVAAANLAALYRVQRQFPAAVENARKAVALNANDPHNLLELADSLAAANVRSDAMAVYRQAAHACEDQLQTEKENGPDLMLLALLRAKLGEQAAGTDAMTRADKAGAGDMDSQLYKVRTLELLGRRVEAVRLAKICLNRGATAFQMELSPDLSALRSDEMFRSLAPAVAL